MPKSIQNCSFCDSKRHNETDCVHNFNGRRNLLETCMSMNEMPNFHSYTKKELKFVSHITPHTNTIIRTRGSEEYEYDPIPLTLCKYINVHSYIFVMNIISNLIQVKSFYPPTSTYHHQP